MELGVRVCDGCGALVPDQLWEAHENFHGKMKQAPAASWTKGLIFDVGHRRK